jgi:ATP-dependent helicase/nuclease subunit A
MTTTETPAPPAPDQTARDRIERDLGATLFVEAGAGSGKTTALVRRVVALVVGGEVEMGAIAAVTFTEKAAAELRDRVRQALEKAETTARLGSDEVQAERCRAAVDQLDTAAIGTLHAFAQRLLSENPIEAGLPPRLEVLDEVSSDAEFERRWRAFRDALLDDPAMERSLLLLFATGVRHDALAVLARHFNSNWDLVEERVPANCPEPPPVRELVEPVLAELEAIGTRLDDCLDAADKLHVRIRQVLDHVARLRAIDDELALLEALGPDADGVPSFKSTAGAKTKWKSGCDLPALRAQLAAAGEALTDARNTVAAACAKRIGSALRGFTLDAAEARRRNGQLEFHDLLVLARALVRDADHGSVVRRRLHDRYQRLLLDEFQDTDPIQIELAVRIAAADPGGDDARTLPWWEVPVAPGRLFVVGDPKQSIYRFRRADISLFLQARDRFGAADGGLVELTANFRSDAGVIDWVNTVFDELLALPADVSLPVESQPAYRALTPTRPRCDAGPAVSVLGASALPHGVRADELRSTEAAAVVNAVTRAVTEGWEVTADDGGRRPARLGDVTVLVPARTSLPFLEDALEAAGIPYRAESSSIVYATRAIRDLFLVARAVDDPTDLLTVVSALRTPLLACGDDDLVRFKVELGGHWNYTGPQPDGVPADDPVRVALGELRRLHRQRHWLSPSQLLDTIARDRFTFELGFAEGRPRDVWRRLRFVIDQARQWTDATGGGLRDYLRWVQQQTAEGARVAEAVLPETDDDAVRIMTIHAAKGLEFPVTIVSGMSTASQGRATSAEVRFTPDGKVGYQFGSKVRTLEFEESKPVDEQMGLDERIRLLYVACTRAKDHLVVSVHRTARKNPPDLMRKRTNAELLVLGMGDELLTSMPDAGAPLDASIAPPAPGDVEAPMPFDEWEAERTRVLDAAGVQTTFSATSLTDEGLFDAGLDAGAGPEDADPPVAGLQKRPPDLDLPPWLKGRYGTAVGRAVHGVLQTIDLGAPSDDEVAAAVASQCEAEAVPDRVETVEALVRQALGSPSVREAARRPHWREIYACAPIGDGGRLLEGYIDLLYRADDGLVVVDYKTAATSDPERLAERVHGYRAQGAAYALTMAETTGEPVVSVVFVFLTPGGAVEIELDDLEGAVAVARAALEHGRGLSMVAE